MKYVYDNLPSMCKWSNIAHWCVWKMFILPQLYTERVKKLFIEHYITLYTIILDYLPVNPLNEIFVFAFCEK